MKYSAPLPALLLILLPVVLAWPVLFGLSQDPMDLTSYLMLHGRPGWLPGLGNLDLNAGVTTQALGHLAAEQWLAGRVPWWNPYSGIGMPLAGEMQASALFLPFVLLLHFGQGPLLLRLAMQMVAGLSTYALLRQLQLSRGMALLGGALYGMAGTFATLQHGPMMPIAFLPLFVLGIERARTGGVAILAVAVLFSITAGFPETAYLNVLLALAWAIARVCTDPAPWRLAGRIGVGGALGLLMAAPALWSFAHFLLHGTSENHRLSFFGALTPSISGVNMLLWLFPYATGPVGAFLTSDPGGAYPVLISYHGGYVGAGIVTLALAGLFGRGHRAVRWAAGLFVALALLYVLAVPGVADAINLIPLLSMVLVPRYAIAAMEFACIVLAVLAVDDWRRGSLRSWARWVALGGVLITTAVALGTGWPVLARMAATAPGFLHWPVAALAYGLALVATLLVLLRARPTRLHVAIVCGLLVADGALMTTVGYATGQRDVEIDTAATTFLHDRVGLQRFYTLGPYRPNYGAYFATGQLNYEYLPIPRDWATYVTTALDPAAHPVMFRGDGPEPPGTPADAPTHAQSLIGNMDAYLALGVSYIVTPHDGGPWSRTVATGVPGTGGTVTLEPGQSLDGTVTVPAGTLSGFSLALGTFNGQADGRLTIEVCATECRAGVIDVRGAADNAFARVALNPPLPQSGQPLRWRATYADSARGIAVYGGAAAMVRVEYQPDRPVPPIIYLDRIMDVYQVLGLPYADSVCRLTVRGLDKMDAQCDEPGVLVRRALFFDGWRATVNGVSAAIEPYQGVMQQIALPAGASTVRFWYAPPYAGLCWVLAALGLGGVIVLSRMRCFTLIGRAAKLRP